MSQSVRSVRPTAAGNHYRETPRNTLTQSRTERLRAGWRGTIRRNEFEAPESPNLDNNKNTAGLFGAAVFFILFFCQVPNTDHNKVAKSVRAHVSHHSDRKIEPAAFRGINVVL